MLLECKKIIQKTLLAAFLMLSCIHIEAIETKGFLTEDEIALFYQQGYILKPQCLTQEEMAQLSKDVTAVVERALNAIPPSQDPTFSQGEHSTYIDGSRIVYRYRPDQSVSIARINGCGGMLPTFLQTVRSEKMLHTFFELLGTDDLEHLITQIHPKLPADAISFPRHRDIEFRRSFDPDWQDVLGNGSYTICIIPIDPMTPENGGLWIDKNNYPEPQGLEEDLVWIFAQPGDLLFLHPHLYHGSGPNLHASNSRRTLLTGFCAFGANHKPYPGAYVNTRCTLTPEGEISLSPSPWSQCLPVTSDAGH